MTTRSEILCIVKFGRSDPHERIASVGGNGFRFTQSEAIARIQNKTNEFWTRGGGKTAEVIVATHSGHPYLKTTNDGVQPDNLLALPSCS